MSVCVLSVCLSICLPGSVCQNWFLFIGYFDIYCFFPLLYAPSPFLQDLEHKSFQDSFLAALKESDATISHFPLTEASDAQILDIFGNATKESVNAFGSPVETDDKKKRYGFFFLGGGVVLE